MRFCRLFCMCFVVLISGRGFAQQDEVVALTEAGITEAFNGVDMLREMSISAIQEINADNAEAVLLSDYSFEVPGVNVTIRKGAVTFNKRAPEEASLLLARREADLLMSLDLPVFVNDQEYHATMSKWKWTGAAKYEDGATNQQDSKSYIVIRLNGDIRVADFGDLVSEFGGGDIPLLNMVEDTAMRNPEIIVPLGLDLPILFAVFEAVIGGENKEVDIYGFSMSPKANPLQKVKSLTLMVDYHSIPIRLQELAVMVEEQAGAAGFSSPFNIFDPGNARVKDAAVVMAMKTMDIEIRDLDPVMQVPFSRIYGEGKQLPLHFLRGVNMVATFTPEDFPAFYEYFEKLNFARDLLLTVQGSIGYESAGEKEEAPDPEGKDEEKEKNSAQVVGEYLKLGLYVGLSTWDIPQYLAEKGYRVVEGAGFEFFIEHVPAALQFGVASHFDVNLGGRVNADGSANQDDVSPVRLAGALQAVFTSTDVGMALAGKMIGVWRTPAGIPFAIKDPVMKVKITADNTYYAGAKGSYYIGHEGEEKKILVGGNLGIQYTGYEAHPKAGAFKGGINSLTVQDLVNMSNIMNAMNDGTWRPWDVPDGPLPMGDIYNAKLENVFLQMVSPGAGDADLKFGTEGAVGSGTLIYQDQILGDVFFEVGIANWIPIGARIYGHLKDFSFASAVFDGADVEIAVAANDLPPRFIVKTGFALGEERLGVDIFLNVPKPHAKATFPNSIKELAKTSPTDVVDALQNLQNMDIADLVITNPEILVAETLQWGAFVLENTAMWVVNEAGQLKLKVRGEKIVYGVRVGVEGEWIGDQGEFILRADAEGNYPLRDLNFAYVNTELHYNGQRAWARATGRASKAGVGADMVIEIPNPEEGHGSGDAEIHLKEYVVQGTAALHHDSEKTELKLTVNPGMSLEKYDLSGLDLRGMAFDNVNMFHVNLSDANLERVSFKGSDLSDANMMNCYGREAIFQDAKIIGTYMDKAEFRNANFAGASVSRSRFTGTKMFHVNFSGANLEDATFVGADLSDANLIDSHCKNAIFQDATIIGTYMDKAEFEGVSFAGANLSRSTFIGANLMGSNLAGANFAGANLSNAVVDAGTNFANVTGLGDAIGVDSMVGLELVTMGKDLLDPYLGPALDELANRAIEGAVAAMDALSDIQTQGYETVDKTVQIANWSLGNFVVNGHVHFSGTKEDVSMSVTGDVGFAGNTARFSGTADATSGDLVLTADAGTANFRHVPATYNTLTLRWNKANPGAATIRNMVTVGGDAKADIDLEIREPDDASGSGAVEISMNAYKVGGQAVFVHRLDETRLTLTVNPDTDLTHFDLSGLDLRGMAFDKTNLNEANLTGANLEGVSFNGTNAVNANFSKAILKHAVLQDADFSHVNFNDANLERAQLSHWTIIDHAKMSHVYAPYIKMHNVKAHYVDCYKSDFSHANINSDISEGTKMRDGWWIETKFDDSVFENVDFTATSLKESDFSRVKIYYSSLNKGLLEHTRLYATEFIESELRDINWQNTVMDNATYFPRSVISGGENMGSIKGLTKTTWDAAKVKPNKDALGSNGWSLPDPGDGGFNPLGHE